MKNKLLLVAVWILAFMLMTANVFKTSDVSNFGRLVLGEDNYGTDPNPTADITGANDESISNNTNGRWDFGAADLYTTGAISVGGATFSGALTGITNLTMTGDLLGADSVKARVLYLSEALANVTNITMTGDLLGADSVKGRVLYLSGALSNVTDITATGDLTGADSVSTTKLYAGSSFTVGTNVGAADTFGVTWATNNQELMDTVTVTNGLATSVYLVTIKKAAAPVAGDLLSWAAIEGKLVVYRIDTTTSNLGYSWIKIK